MSLRPKICQMVPTTFHGMSSGSAISTRQTGTPQPLLGMLRAMTMPSGISIARTTREKIRLRPIDSQNRCEWRISANQSEPFQKNSLLPNVSWTE